LKVGNDIGYLVGFNDGKFAFVGEIMIIITIEVKNVNSDMISFV